MTRVNGSLRKAAILVDSLDPRSADALLDQMSSSQAAQVRQAVMELHDITPDEREQVIADFLGRDAATVLSSRSGSESDGGVEMHLSALSESHIPRDDAKPSPTLTSTTASPDARPADENNRTHPFEFLHHATPETLKHFLEREHPQVAALVLAHLAPSQSAAVIAQLPDDIQCDVLRRIVDLDAADPQTLREVEAQIKTLLSEHLRMAQRRSVGIATISAILRAADGDDRQRVLKNLRAHDDDLVSQLAQQPSTQPPTTTSSPAITPAPTPATAPTNTSKSSAPIASEQARQQPDVANAARQSRPANRGAPRHRSNPDGPGTSRPKWTFDRLKELSDASLAQLLRHSDPGVALLALTGASTHLTERIFSQLPPRTARQLRTKMENLGPLRLSDIELAQEQLSELASRLIEENIIPEPGQPANEDPRRRFTVAA